ncbi:patatin-like phospholipase family protein [Tunicatimonas pelagia]|uniref:patatin-like phospholipase family protein n=1 Tax=Tunicatimonas pelagia TaxID=931531 RepID=UPI0026659AC0|nr:patatin-like phospholipase family protein [Tunicatimonas pelagia]WKN42057.1 patatin-like phospholipase family protein [Tunicatimonas pelagia]
MLKNSEEAEPRRRQLGLVLSGGGARGIAHLGVLKVLDELGIKIGAITGSSSGAIAGALYASGYSPDDILRIINETNFFRLIRPAISKTGLLKMDSAEWLYDKYLPKNSFEELKIPLTINATDLRKGKTVYFSKGELIRPLMASTCIPVMFEPISFQHQLYVDGGLLNNFPAEALIGSCDKLIGLHCNPIDDTFKVMNIRTMLERTFLLTINANSYSRRKYCDFFIEPPALNTYHIFDLGKANEIFQIGYNYARELEAELTQFWSEI